MELSIRKLVLLILLLSCQKNLKDIDISEYKKAIYFYKLKNYDSTIYYLKNFLRKVPRYKEISDTIINAHFLLAKALEEKKEYETTLFVYNELIKYIQKTYGYNSRLENEVYKKMTEIYEKMGLKERANEIRKKIKN
jgi:TolA-binding protein